MNSTDSVTAPGFSGMPARIGRYEILGRLGKGAMGVVYRARDSVMDRLVAVKVLMADIEAEPEIRKRFYREAKAAGCLLHRNIITIFDIGEADGRLFIVMELLVGHTLGDFMKRQEAADIEQKLDLMMQVCEGLGAAHAHGIIHRDIKPGNLFVTPDGTLKVLDFGVARLATSTMTASGFIMGTPDYMSPEQARGREVDERADLFSAGAVFYWMLSGRKPFAADDLPTVLRKVQTEDPPPLQEATAPGPLLQIVLRALAKDPAHRYPHASDLLSDLARFKRHFDGHTRRLGAQARERFESILSLEAAVRTSRQALAVPGAGDDPDPVKTLRSRYPALAEGADSLALMPLRRVRIQETLAALEEYQARRLPEAKALERASGELEAGEALLAEGDCRAALARLEAAKGFCPASERVSEALVLARRRAGERDALDEGVRSLARQAREAMARRTWQAAVDLCDQALALDPEAVGVAELRGRAANMAAEEGREQARQRQRLLERAAHAIDAGRFADAEARLREVRTLQPMSESADRLQAKLEATRALARRAQDEIEKARLMFAGGRRDDALRALLAFREAEPDAPDVKDEIARLKTEAERLAELERRQREAALCIRRAEAALASGNAELAEGEAHAALDLDRSDTAASRILIAAQEMMRAAAEGVTRRAKAAAHVAHARQLLAAGAFPKALREAEHALALEPDNNVAVLLATLARRGEEEIGAARERERLVREQLKSAEAVLAIGRNALADGELGRARWAAEKALATVPDMPEAQVLLNQVLAMLAAQPGAVDPDDTVDLAILALGPSSGTADVATRSAPFMRVVNLVGRRTAELLNRLRSMRR